MLDTNILTCLTKLPYPGCLRFSKTAHIASPISNKDITFSTNSDKSKVMV